MLKGRTIYALLAMLIFLACKSDDSSSSTGLDCPAIDVLSFSNIGCELETTETAVYTETVTNDIRSINTNVIPNHKYGLKDNLNIDVSQNNTFEMDATPVLSASTTSILSLMNRPQYFFGVGLNGVLFAPAPATPFIFVNEITGEYNWDWVFEPTTNMGDGKDLVALDCSTAHQGPQGYHYHGNPVEYVETILTGIAKSDVVPSNPIQIGWAADGFPIIYRYGPTSSGGGVEELLSSYDLKDGDRGGDGITAPCGEYSGKYTNDFEYVSGLGDLDECNGLERDITLNGQTFSYFYVVTEDFPQVGRCFSGVPDNSFK